ncbi:MAG TPA: Mov34/MPN/PAD-1 family protein [Armatimonadota bacterium]|jgi:proteasome lid subunit RPN8/RPN11
MTDQTDHPTEDLPISLAADATPVPGSLPVRLVLRPAALEAIRAHGYTDTEHECGGVMLGEKLEGETGALVLVEAVIAGAHNDNRRGSVTFTHETWEQINQEKDQKYSNLRMVGWYHTHPGFGIFLSDYDQFIQRNFFDLPWNVAFVLDPLSGDSGAFGWAEGQIVPLAEYELLQPARPVAPTGAAANAAQGTEEDMEPTTPVVSRSSLRWSRVFVAVVAVVLVVLLVLGAGVLWMNAIQKQAEAPAPQLPRRAAPVAAPGPAPSNALAPAEATPPPEASNQLSTPAPETSNGLVPRDQPGT